MVEGGSAEAVIAEAMAEKEVGCHGGDKEENPLLKRRVEEGVEEVA